MKINILLNPACAEPRKVMTTIKANFPNDDLKMYYSSQHHGEYFNSIYRAARPADLLIAVGGDGTINEAVNVIAGSETTLGIIPSGTANDLAAQLKLPRDINAACDIFKSGKFFRIDLIRVNGRYYATAGGLGYSSRVVEIANQLKKHSPIKTFGNMIYVLASMLALNNTSYRINMLELKADGGREVLNAFAVFVNNQECLGGKIRIAPGACNHDSAFNVCVIRNPLTRLQVLSLLYNSIKGSHGKLPFVRFQKGARLRIECRKSVKYFGDGEILAEGKYFELRLIPRSLKLAVSEEYQGQ